MNTNQVSCFSRHTVYGSQIYIKYSLDKLRPFSTAAAVDAADWPANRHLINGCK